MRKNYYGENWPELVDSAMGLGTAKLQSILSSGNVKQSDLRYVFERFALPKDVLAKMLYLVDVKYIRSFCKHQNSVALHEVVRENNVADFSKIMECLRDIVPENKVWEALEKGDKKALKKIIKNQSLTEKQVLCLLDKNLGLIEFYWDRHRLPRKAIIKILRMPVDQRNDRGLELFAANLSKEFCSLDYQSCADILSIDDEQVEKFFANYVKNQESLKVFAYMKVYDERAFKVLSDVVLPKEACMKLDPYPVLKTMYKNLAFHAVALGTLMNQVNEVQLDFEAYPFERIDAKVES